MVSNPNPSFLTQAKNYEHKSRIPMINTHIEFFSVFVSFWLLLAVSVMGRKQGAEVLNFYVVIKPQKGMKCLLYCKRIQAFSTAPAKTKNPQNRCDKAQKRRNPRKARCCVKRAWKGQFRCYGVLRPVVKDKVLCFVCLLT